jgi:hypothetical protein
VLPGARSAARSTGGAPVAQRPLGVVDATTRCEKLEGVRFSRWISATRFALRVACIAACGAVASCSLLREQVAINSVNACIEKQCHAEVGKARQQCMTSCQREYDP